MHDAAPVRTQCLIGTLLLSHWFACIWGLQASFATSKLDTWLGGYDLCVQGPDGSEVCEGPGFQYSAAIYWAVMTMTSIGAPALDVPKTL